MDFVSDGLADGSKLRCLNVVDDCNDPAESAHLKPLKHRPRRAFSWPVPDAAADDCKSLSNRQSPDLHAARFRTDAYARTALSGLG